MYKPRFSVSPGLTRCQVTLLGLCLTGKVSLRLNTSFVKKSNSKPQTPNTGKYELVEQILYIMDSKAFKEINLANFQSEEQRAINDSLNKENKSQPFSVIVREAKVQALKGKCTNDSSFK